VLRPGAKTTARELRRFAAGRLAEFKVPSRVVILEEIPKGPTGKLQRIGLAEKLGISGSEEAVAGERAPFVAPRNPVEETVAALWRDVLRLETVGVNDRFLELGGDSLMATMLVSRIRSIMHVELSLIDFFDASTIEEQARLIERMRMWNDGEGTDTETRTSADRR
jgi:acyl carrier protein